MFWSVVLSLEGVGWCYVLEGNFIFWRLGWCYVLESNFIFWQLGWCYVLEGSFIFGSLWMVLCLG
jgi:hypothetical protein